MTDAPQHDTGLSLAESAEGPSITADWVGKLFMLGRLAERWSRSVTTSQLVVVLSVPVRDFAAVLVACGWMTSTPTHALRPVDQVLSDAGIGTPVRVLTQDRIFVEPFRGIDERGLAQFESKWIVEKLVAASPADSADSPRKQSIPQPGVISRLTGLNADWAARLCSPPEDIALVGMKTLIQADLSAHIGRGAELEPVSNILLPVGTHPATWATHVFAPPRLEEEPLPTTVRAAILDGASPTRYLRAILAPVVVCILPRSIADESVLEGVMDYRSTSERPFSLARQFGWVPPIGVEALAFEVPL